jgi:N6-adenosine-specific RNA methylase IME4
MPSPSLNLTYLALDDVKLGVHHRRCLGDIESLAKSILRTGLLHPIVVKPDKTLVVGRRRLEAFKLLAESNPRYKRIPANVAGTFEELGALLQAEADENICRLDFSPTEAVAMGAAIEEAVRPLKRAAQEAAGKEQGYHGKEGGRGRKKPLGGSSPKGFREPRTDDIAAAAVGVDRRTYEKAKAVVASGDKALISEMDRTRKVSGVHRKLVVCKTAAQIAKEPPPLPEGPFRVIVADPPWRYELRPDDPSHRGTIPYPTMTVEEIASMDVKALAHKDSVLWLWVTNAFLPDVWPIIEAWGFQYKTCLTWVKNRVGVGNWLRGQTEHCLMCVRGKPTIRLTNQTTVIHGNARKHSQKPEEFYALIESLCPGSKLEMFSRQRRKGWQYHGDKGSSRETGS